MPEPNHALAELTAEAGFSWAGLARRVNSLGADEGMALRYDYTAVNRWVKRGERPRPPVPALIARALSERLGRRVDAGDFGMVETRSLVARGLTYPDSADGAIRTIIDLGRVDLSRRGPVEAPFLVAALGGPSRDWLLAQLDKVAGDRGRASWVSARSPASGRCSLSSRRWTSCAAADTRGPRWWST